MSIIWAGNCPPKVPGRSKHHEHHLGRQLPKGPQKSEHGEHHLGRRLPKRRERGEHPEASAQPARKELAWAFLSVLPESKPGALINECRSSGGT